MRINIIITYNFTWMVNTCSAGLTMQTSDVNDAKGMFTTQLDYPYAQPTILSDENDYEIQQENNGLQPKDLRPNATDRYIKRIGKSRKLLREY